MRIRNRLRLGVLAAGFAILSVGIGPARADQRLALPVPTVTIYPGDVIKDEMLTERNFSPRYPGRASVIDSRAAITGQVARRTLLPGHPIPINAVEEPNVVKRGVPVQVVYREGGLTIIAYASPLQNGGVGSLIRLRNMDTGVVIVGTVQADGTIRLSDG